MFRVSGHGMMNTRDENSEGTATLVTPLRCLRATNFADAPFT